jgi:hypothetical protein
VTWRAIFWIVLITLFLPTICSGDTTSGVLKDPKTDALKDPKTGIIYYLELDQCHLVAISPDGKILWNLEIIMPPKFKGSSFGRFAFNDENSIFLSDVGGNIKTMIVDKKTGKLIGEMAR